jgi:hypothetical protein
LICVTALIQIKEILFAITKRSAGKKKKLPVARKVYRKVKEKFVQNPGL